ncbi:MAG: DUF1800 domain-containing protein [Acidimicrobiia bacterium]|nr:DUF1800 domain-containing protein [Acidimicrobiia bacterium]
MSIRLIALVALLALHAALSPHLRATSGPSDHGEILHVLNRLSYGPRPGDVERVSAMGVQRWIEAQLTPAKIDNAALERKLTRLETLALDARTLQRDYLGPAMAERRRRQAAEGTGGAPRSPEGTDNADSDMRGRTPASAAQRKSRQVLADLEEAKLLRAVYSERQLEEILVDFWFNHFNVNAGKGATRNYVGDYEREAIRPHVLGRFRDMLGATAKHPAMLFYLDNWLSSTPGAPGARSSGLNENYARELLELHTLGVDGGYAQQDIVNVAKAFTGWTLQPRQGSGFIFAANRHERGAKVVLGHTLRAGGVDDGEQVLDIVAAHPSTARHLATKLAIRFVSDTPPAGLIDRAAAKFTATSGDLREVVKLIVTSPEFMAADASRAKVKTPLEYVASALRATGADIRNAVPLARALRDMGMPLYLCQPPTGYDETAATWVNAGALVSRMNFAVDLSKNAVRGVRVPLTEEQTLAMKIGAPEFQRQ